MSSMTESHECASCEHFGFKENSRSPFVCSKASRQHFFLKKPDWCPLTKDENMTEQKIFHTAKDKTKTEPTPMMKFFEYGHLPSHLAEISAPFCELATALNSRFDLCPREKQVAIRKLLEAKDAAVRAAL